MNFISKLVSIIIILSTLFLSSTDVYAQKRHHGKSSKAKKKEKMKDAETSFNDGNYDVSLKLYLKLLKKDKLNSNYNYRIGICYLETYNDRSKAISYLEYASQKDDVLNDVFFRLAKAYFYAHKFDKAIDKFNYYLKVDKELFITYPEIEDDVLRSIEECKNAKVLLKDSLDITFINMGSRINTKRNEYCPLLTEDEDLLFYTNDKKYISDFQEYTEDIYMTPYNRNKWGKGKKLNSKINTSEEHERLTGISPNADILYVLPDNYLGYDDVYTSSKFRKKYMDLENIGNNINSEFEESGACGTRDMDTIYFSSNIDGGYGGYDIYMSLKLPNGDWGIPQNLGTSINTKYDEDYPRISSDSKTLYFSSQGHNSMGGFDVFKSKINPKNNRWGKAKNIGYPLNDTYDNWVMSMSEKGRYAYVSKYLPNGKGGLDIYKAIFNKEEQKYVAITGKIEVGAGSRKQQIKDVDNELTITITDKKADDEYGEWTYNKETGNYVISLPPGSYQLLIEGEKYKPYKEDLEITEELTTKGVIIKDIALKIDFNKKPK